MGRYMSTDSGHEGASMSIQGSLRAQLLALLGGSILLLVIISLLCFRLLEHGVELSIPG
jgi:hypothetical protein